MPGRVYGQARPTRGRVLAASLLPGEGMKTQSVRFRFHVLLDGHVLFYCCIRDGHRKPLKHRFDFLQARTEHGQAVESGFRQPLNNNFA